ncbi:anti-sigma factor C-terminal domain-containing protein [Aminipila sp.]|uniref:anti-sigma factor C-terminal domain-containing protein n=1 Tax=Aminipila sp. TaxID=2060095 RepID=UPI00289730C7|nr:anti-sigma factor C-terminal domain-containing protein [Aminipila sp.]
MVLEKTRRSYGELLELYKKGELDEKQGLQIEADINKLIRRAFVKMGVIVCIVTLAVVVFVQLALPDIVSYFYYDPGKEISEDCNQISRDMAVYSELVIPAYVRDDIRVDAGGYGKYDIRIYQDVSYNGRFTNIAGKIEKGKITLYDMNSLKRPTGNLFAWFQMHGNTSKSLTQLITEGKENFCAAGDTQMATEALNKLNEKEMYVAYVTLDRMMSYEEFMKFISNKDHLTSTWCAVVTNGQQQDTSVDSMFRADNIGFQCGLTKSTELTWDKDKYPNLLLWDEGDKDIEILKQKMKTETYMKTHFVSMLKYVSKQEKFLKMMDENPEKFSNAADYVENHGITVYGFAAMADKETLLELNKMSQIYEIYTEPLK